MDSVRILVLGAGVAGLSASIQLIKKGFKNVKIFEARDRVGGRVYSKNFDSGVIEFGAQWIHGQKGNSVYEICKELKLVDEECQHFLEKFNVFHQIKSPRHKELMTEASAYILELIDECQELSLEARKTNKKVAPSLKHFLEEKFTAKFLNAQDKKSRNPEDEEVFRVSLDWALRLQHEINGCSDTSDVSAQYIGDYIECDGNNVTELGAKGYRAFIEYLAKQIPDTSIQLNTIVTKIDYSGQGSVKVTLSSGICEEFDHVICTLPLGVLKTKSVMFHPPLPYRKQLAIESIGFGAVDKIYLEYDEKDSFWESGDVFQILWTGSNKPAPGQKKWYHSIGRINAVRNQSRLLVCWITGDGAKEMEKTPDLEILDRTHQILTMVLERDDLPKAKAVHKSTWFSDPYSRGSYSYIAVACDETNALPCDLADPIIVGSRPAVCFAGEATSYHFYSTVHGAYDSGVREADRLANHYKAASSSAKPNLSTTSKF